MKETSYDELTDVCDEKTEVCSGSKYPFAFVLRLRVMQIVCGISTMVMGAVALIEEKSQFNLGIGFPAGVSTIMAAAHNIYSSRGFDGYQPSTRKNEKWEKIRFLGPTVRIASVNVILWSLAISLILTLTFNSVKTFFFDTPSSTVITLAGIEFFFSFLIVGAVFTILWVDLHNDPDWQEPSDIIHSNTGTAVSMVTLSQSVVT